MKYELHSHEGAGPLKFGMKRAEVRKAVGGKFESDRRDPDDDEEVPYDYFTKEEFFVYYNAEDECEAIEFAGGEPMFEGKNLLKLSFEELLKLMKKLDKKVEFDGSGFTSEKLGIGSYAPNGEDEPEEPAEGVIVFRKGYYDSEE